VTGIPGAVDISEWTGTADAFVRFFGIGGAPPVGLNKPATTLVATKSGKGYYFCAEDGGVFCFGDAVLYGSLPGDKVVLGPGQEIVGMALSETGLGYWLLGADGGIFAFGDAQFLGSI
jgi:hypothetical protein